MPLSRRASMLALTGLCLASSRPARSQPMPPTALTGARPFDGERLGEPATVLIQDGLIRAIGREAPPEGARRVDLTGHCLLPGMTADHIHIGHTAGGASGRRFYTRENVQAQLELYRNFGVTNVAALGLNPPPFHALRQDSREGRLPGARFLGAGPGIGVPDGAPPSGPMQLSEDQVARPDSVEAMRRAVDAMAEQGVDLIKIWVDGLGGTLPQMPPEMVRAAVTAAHARGLKVVAHIHDLSQARLAVENGVDILGHGIRDREADPPLIEAMRRQGTWYIPTIQIDEAEYLYADRPELLEDPFFRAAANPALMARLQDPDWRRSQLEKAGPRRAAVRMNQRNLKLLHEAGIRIGYGTDSGATPLRVQGFAEHRELELMVEAGLTPAQALRIATQEAAALLGLEDRGALRPGLRADLVVLAADPTRDIRATRRIRAVWQGGQEVAGPLA